MRVEIFRMKIQRTFSKIRYLQNPRGLETPTIHSSTIRFPTWVICKKVSFTKQTNFCSNYFHPQVSLSLTRLGPLNVRNR